MGFDIFLLQGVKVCFCLVLYHYTIDNHNAQYNIFNGWLVDTRIYQLVTQYVAMIKKFCMRGIADS